MKVKVIPLRDLKNTSKISNLCETGQAEIIGRQKSAVRSARIRQGVDISEVFARLDEKYGK